MRLVASLGTFLSMFYTEEGLVSNPVALTPISLVTEVVYIFPHEISHFLFVQERVCSNSLPVIEWCLLVHCYLVNFGALFFFCIRNVSYHVFFSFSLFWLGLWFAVIFWTVSSKEQSFNFDEVNQLFSFVMLQHVCVRSNKLLPNWKSKYFLLCFLQIIFFSGFSLI